MFELHFLATLTVRGNKNFIAKQSPKKTVERKSEREKKEKVNLIETVCTTVAEQHHFY